MRGKLQEGGPNSNQDELIDSFVRELFGPEVKLDYIDKDGVSSPVRSLRLPGLKFAATNTVYSDTIFSFLYIYYISPDTPSTASKFRFLNIFLLQLFIITLNSFDLSDRNCSFYSSTFAIV
jgi:hypothetical protein